MRRYNSWGNYPDAQHDVRTIRWRGDPLPTPPNGDTLLPHGMGRSYGDSCLNDGGLLIDTTRLDHLIEFDSERGVLRAESGVSLASVLDVIVPRGWFLPVTPGTKFVTLGGAIANDIHGKNHHRAGTFGRFVDRFELLRSDGSRLVCSPMENAAIYRATIGGLGLTGLITWVELRLKRIQGEFLACETVKFANLEEFFGLAVESDERFEYTVAWVDCLARGESLGRGHLLRANHAGGSTERKPRRLGLRVPFNAPGFLLNRYTIRAFNTAYYHRQRRPHVHRTTHYEPFFYPLDSIRDWNRLYGRRGFLQYQCLVPTEAGRDPVRDIFRRIATSGEGSFLAVLKAFGELPSPGLLSFPRPGITLALDFANRGSVTFDLLDDLDRVVRDSGGRVYPAKDARMSADSFGAFFPQWEELAQHVDPAFSSGFWRRVTRGAITGGD